MDRNPQQQQQLIKRRINSAYLIDLMRYYISDKDIYSCRTKLNAEVFRHEWFVAWFKATEVFFHLPLMNEIFFKEQLKKFFFEAHDQLLLFHFFGYYYVKDIEQWILDLAETLCAMNREMVVENSIVAQDEVTLVDIHSSTTATATTATVITEMPDPYSVSVFEQMREHIVSNPPFGVIPLTFAESQMYGHYYLVEDRQRLGTQDIIFECNDRVLCEKYEFRVINEDAHFMPVASTTNKASSWSCDVKPISPFEELKKQRDLIEEAQITLFDCNSMLAYPEGFATAKNIPLSKEPVTEQQLYSFDTILAAKQAEGFQMQDMAMDNTRAQLERINMKRAVQFSRVTADMANGTCHRRDALSMLETESKSIIMERKQQFNRPSVNDALDYVPQSVDIPVLKPSAPIVNVDALIRKYETDVCNTMNLPYTFFKPNNHFVSSAGGSGGHVSRTHTGIGNISQNDLYQKLLENEVKQQQSLFDRIFKQIYGKTFGRLDHHIFSRDDAHFFDDIVTGLRFNNVSVKSDGAIMNLLEFYKAGLIEGPHITQLLYKSYDLPLPVNYDFLNRNGTAVNATTGGPLRLKNKKNKKKIRVKAPYHVVNSNLVESDSEEDDDEDDNEDDESATGATTISV